MKKLPYLSETDEVLAGVCGGLADRLQIESDILRVFFLAAGLYHGVGVFLYLALAMAMPFHPEEAPNDFFERYNVIPTHHKRE